MAERVELKKEVINLKEFQQVVDTSFKFYTEPVVPVNIDTVEELFRLYSKLYLEVPTYGATNSHEYLVTQSSKLYQESNSADIVPLTNEIADLRERLLEANQQIQELTAQLANNVTGNV